MGRARATTSAARRRFLEAADRLFYQHGVRTVGIDRVIAEAGVAKMTLYTHFPSKDDLILAVLQHHERTDLEFFRSTMERHDQKPHTGLSISSNERYPRHGSVRQFSPCVTQVRLTLRVSHGRRAIGTSIALL